MRNKVITSFVTLATFLSSCGGTPVQYYPNPEQNVQVNNSNTIQNNRNITNSQSNYSNNNSSNNNLVEDSEKTNVTDEEKKALEKVFSIEDATIEEEERNIINLESNKTLDVRSPANKGISFSNPLKLDLLYKSSSSFIEKYKVLLDGLDITESVKKGGLKHQWVADFPELEQGKHTLQFIPVKDEDTIYESAFEYQTKDPIDRIVALADATTKRFKIEKMKWDWGEALLVYSLSRLDKHLGEQRYRPFIESYYDYHLKKGLPKINWSDRCAPALAAIDLYKETGNEKYKEIGEKIVSYLKSANRTKAGGLNHFGTYFPSLIYPKSMWVDSLMMYNIFAAKWGKYMNDEEMTKFASEQPLLFAKVLQKPNTNLWKHAYFTNWNRNMPKSEIYWLRGNGWAMASLPETLDQLPENDPNRSEIINVLNTTAEALLPYQSDNGMWHTVINKPGKIYLESSGTALVSYGMMKGVHKGYLPEKFAAPAKKAYLSLLDRFEQKVEGVSMPEISHNTMPYSFLGYSLVPQKNDLAFGLAAMILAGIEHDSEVE